MASGAWREYATGDGASHALFAASSTSEEENNDGALFAASSSEDTACPTTVASSNKRGSLKRSSPSCWPDVGKTTAARDLFHKPCIISRRAWARASDVKKDWLGDLAFVGASHALRAQRARFQQMLTILRDAKKAGKIACLLFAWYIMVDETPVRIKVLRPSKD